MKRARTTLASRFGRAILMAVSSVVAVLLVPVGGVDAEEYQPTAVWGASGNASGQFNFTFAGGIDVDSAGYAYVADSGNHRIQKFTADGIFVAEWGGEGEEDGQLRYPSGVAVGPTGDVYVAEGNNVQRFAPDGSFLQKWGNPEGSESQADGEFYGPDDISTDPAGNVYVADTLNSRIQKFTADGEFLTKWGGSGTALGQFDDPTGVAIAPDWSVLVSDWSYSPDLDFDRVQRFTADGGFLTAWGRGGEAPGQFELPWDIAVDRDGYVYVADAGKHRIEKFTADGRFVGGWGSEGEGYGQFGSQGPSGVAVDAIGNVYVVDRSNDRIERFSPVPQRPRRKRLRIPTTDRRALLRVACSRAQRCRARVKIVAGRRMLARGRYSVRAQRSRRVRIGLTQAGRRTMAHRRRVRARMVVVDLRTGKHERRPVLLNRRSRHR